MSDTKKNWITVTESRYPWERDALDFVRDRWPDHDPYRAWANFEFIALDGSINEVDLLLLTPMGLFLVEIKSRPGRVEGDAGTWTYRVYNPARKIWEMQGVNTNSGAWQPGLMWSAGGDRLLIEWYGPMLVRFRYFAIEPDKFLWRADATFDRGMTWVRDYWTMEVHRVSR